MCHSRLTLELARQRAADLRRAGVSLSDLRVIADPFAPTEALVQLMMVRARQLQGFERSRRPRLARLRALLSN